MVFPILTDLGVMVILLIQIVFQSFFQYPRFSGLKHEQKCACSMVKNTTFLTSYISTYRNWDPNKIYHIYSNRKITNCLPLPTNNQPMDIVLSNLCIAWMEQPIIYFNVSLEESQKFFNTFLEWIDQVSDCKVFEYATKIKNKSDPQQNNLWFTEKTYQPLHAWLVNEFEKIIVKNFFNRDSYDLDNFSKIKKLKIGASKNFNKKQSQMMLAMKIQETKLKNPQDFQAYRKKVKVYEDKYYEEVALLMDYDAENMDGLDENGKKKKKKKNKNKKKSKKKKQNDEEQEDKQPTSKNSLEEKEQITTQHIQNNTKLCENNSIQSLTHQFGKKEQIKSYQEIVSSAVKISAQVQDKRQAKDEGKPKYCEIEIIHQNEKEYTLTQEQIQKRRKQEQQPLLKEEEMEDNYEYEWKQVDQNIESDLSEQISEEVIKKKKNWVQKKVIDDQQESAENNESQQIKPKNASMFVEEYEEEEQEEDISAKSITWSNVETYTKSGQSHPQFSQVSPLEQTERNQRSLSPQSTHHHLLNHHRKRKNKKKNKNPQTGIISNRNNQYHHHEVRTSITAKNNALQFQQEQECRGIRFHQNTHKKQHKVAEGAKDNQDWNEDNCSEAMQRRFVENDNEANDNGKCQKKRRRKNNKGVSLLKELCTRISTTLINKQINNFVDAISIETNRLYDHKIISFERISTYIKLFFPSCHTTLFGSNAVGLSLPTSDIDIMISNLPCTCEEQAKEILAHLAVQINSMAWIVSCSAYLKAKVPLVKLQIDPRINFLETKRKNDYFISPFDPQFLNKLQLRPKKQSQRPNYHHSYSQSPGNQYTYHHNYHSQHHHQQNHEKNQINSSNQIIKADITINLNNQSTFATYSTELMRAWIERYRQISIVTLAFKYILAQRGFSSNFKGGIGSYCLFVMIAAYISEFKYLQELGEGQIFMGALKFYGEEFQNQIKSIKLPQLPQSSKKYYKYSQDCPSFEEQEISTIAHKQEERTSNFISLQETYQILKCDSQDNNYLMYNIQSNPLRIVDPINNRIMSGSCYLYPQIKSQFRRIYKQLSEAKESVEKEAELTIHSSQIPKILQNKKSLDKWINKYETRSGFSMKNILDGGF